MTHVTIEIEPDDEDEVEEVLIESELNFLYEFRMITGEDVYSFNKAYLSLKKMSELHLEELDKLECDLKAKETMSLEAHKNLTKDFSFKERFNVANRITFYKDQSWKNGIIQDIKDDEICIIIDGTDYPICIPLKDLDLPCINIPDDQYENLKVGDQIVKHVRNEWRNGEITNIKNAYYTREKRFSVFFEDDGSTEIYPFIKGFYKV